MTTLFLSPDPNYVPPDSYELYPFRPENKVSVSGDTMTGQLTLPGGGTGKQAATIQDVEQLIADSVSDNANLVTLNGTQELTNKTLTSPIITNPTITSPTITNPTLTGAVTNSFLVNGTVISKDEIVTISSVGSTTLAEIGKLYILTVNANITLPAAPQLGYKLWVKNMSTSTSVVVYRNGASIMNFPEDFTIDMLHNTFEFTFTPTGWIVS